MKVRNYVVKLISGEAVWMLADEVREDDQAITFKQGGDFVAKFYVDSVEGYYVLEEEA